MTCPVYAEAKRAYQSAQFCNMRVERAEGGAWICDGNWRGLKYLDSFEAALTYLGKARDRARKRWLK